MAQACSVLISEELQEVGELCLTDGIARLPVSFLPSAHVTLSLQRTYYTACDFEFIMSMGKIEKGWAELLLG